MCQKRQLTLQAARLQNQEEFLVDEAHTRLSSSVSDLLGLSAQRMRRALAEGEKLMPRLGGWAPARHPEQACDALDACAELDAVYRLLKATLEELGWSTEQIGKLDAEMANLLRQHQDAFERL